MSFRLPRNVWLLGLVSFFTDFSAQMVYPLLPQFLISLGATSAIIGLIEGIAEATAALLRSVSGRWSDRAGRRKPFVYFGYGLAALARPLLYFAGSWGHVLAIRFTDRIGKAARNPPRDVLLSTAASATRQGYAFGIQRAFDRVGCILGPLAAMAILYWSPENLRLVFLLSVVPGLLALSFLPFVREYRGKAKARKRGGDQPVHSRAFLFFLVANVLFTLGNSSNAFLILKAGEAGIATAMIPVLWMLYNAVCALAAPLFGGLSDRVGRRPVIVAAFAFYALLYVLFGLSTTALAIWLLFAAYGIYYGLSSGVFKAYIADITPPEERGTAYGLFTTAVGLALLPASVLMGYLWDAFGSQTAFFVSAAFSLAGLLVVLITPASTGPGPAASAM